MGVRTSGAFGCVLFEMLTGRPPFAAATASDTLVAVLEREPPWDALPAGLPAAIRRLLVRCLRKNTKVRLRDIGDARLDIEEARSRPDGPAVVESSAHSSTGWWRRVLAVGASLAAAAVIAAGASVLFDRTRAQATSVTRSVIALQAFDRRRTADVSGQSPAVRFEQTAVASRPMASRWSCRDVPKMASVCIAVRWTVSRSRRLKARKAPTRPSSRLTAGGWASAPRESCGASR